MPCKLNNIFCVGGILKLKDIFCVGGILKLKDFFASGVYWNWKIFFASGVYWNWKIFFASGILKPKDNFSVGGILKLKDFFASGLRNDILKELARRRPKKILFRGYTEMGGAPKWYDNWPAAGEKNGILGGILKKISVGPLSAKDRWRWLEFQFPMPLPTVPRKLPKIPELPSTTLLQCFQTVSRESIASNLHDHRKQAKDFIKKIEIIFEISSSQFCSQYRKHCCPIWT